MAVRSIYLIRDIVVGTCYILYAAVAISMYSVCAYCLNMEKNVGRAVFYKLAVHMSVADIMQIFFNSFTGGILTFFSALQSNYYFNSFCSAMLTTGWFNCLHLGHVMAFNRYMSIVYPHRAKVVFTSTSTAWIIVGCYFIAACYACTLCTPYVNFTYSAQSFSYLYGSDYWSQVFMYINMLVNGINITAMALWYLLTYRHIRNETQKISDHNISKAKNRDLRVLYQAVLVCSLLTANSIAFTIDQFAHTVWYICLLTNVLWLISIGSNPIVYISFNSAIKRRLRNYVVESLKMLSVYAMSKFNASSTNVTGMGGTTATHKIFLASNADTTTSTKSGKQPSIRNKEKSPVPAHG